MHRRILLIAMFFSPLNTLCQAFHSPSTQLLVVPGYSARYVSVFSLPTNAASVAQLENSTVGILSSKKFMMKELSTIHIAAGVISRSANFAVNVLSSGFSGYRENEVGFNAAKKLGVKMDAGIRLVYTNINVPGYGRSFATSGEAGIIFHLSDNIHAGIQVKNPVAGKFSGSGNTRLPSIYSMGVAYEPSLFTSISIILVKEEFQPINVNATLQYHINARVRMIAGIHSSSSSMYCGTGIILSTFIIEVTAGYHQVLGFSPQLSISVPFKKRQ